MNKPHIIDVHQHCFPPDYRAVLERCGMTVHATLDSPIPKWSLEAHLAGMDKAGVAFGLLTITGGFIYSKALTRECNEYFASIIKAHPTRLGAFAALPFPDIEATLEEIKYAMDVLKLDGVGMMTNVRGHYLGDPEFAPIFDELNRRKAVVCIHPNDAPFEPLQKVKAPWAAIEFPLETTRTFGYMLWGGTLERCPDIKFIIPHAGGAIPFVIGRYSMTKSPELLLRQYYDTSGSANKWALGGLQNFCDPSHILFGSDFGMVSDPARLLDTIKGLRDYKGFDAKTIMQIEHDNALELLPRLKTLGF